MTLRETLSALTAAGSEQTRKTYARHGVKGEMFGVSYATLGKLKRSIKSDHSLAQELWRTGNHDARVLATMIADPALCSLSLLSDWVSDLDNSVLAGSLAGLASQTASAQSCFRTRVIDSRPVPGSSPNSRMRAKASLKTTASSRRTGADSTKIVVVILPVSTSV